MSQQPAPGKVRALGTTGRRASDRDASNADDSESGVPGYERRSGSA
jgi:hypothetical protein